MNDKRLTEFEKFIVFEVLKELEIMGIEDWDDDDYGIYELMFRKGMLHGIWEVV